MDKISTEGENTVNLSVDFKQINRYDRKYTVTNIKTNDGDIIHFSNSYQQSTEDFHKLVDEYQQKMEETVERTTLPYEPYYEKSNELVKKVNRDIILNNLNNKEE